MIDNETPDLLFVIPRKDRDATNLENSVSWYQSMNRLMESDTSMPNILASLYFLAEQYFHAGFPAALIELVVRRAEIVFFDILRQTGSADALYLQMPVIFYVRLGLFDDAYRVARQTVLVVVECTDFQTDADRAKTIADLNRLLTSPINSRIQKLNKSRKFLHQIKTPDTEMPVAENALELAWVQYLELCQYGLSDMPIS